ncbi:MAG: hypothetical protein M0R66_05370 [Candidatus Omnitrophica bacterium]|nr:hypothetical protein [Candidatus Omnitrophota bacterium]MDD5165802.1 hypothetical protein [Candidatus Omnitrophota bacterium]
MNRIKVVGMLYLILSICGILLYGMLLLRFTLPVLMITAFIATALCLGMLGWVGFIMLKTPQLKD